MERQALSQRSNEIDLLRFLAATGVMLFHYTYLGHTFHLSIEFPALGVIFRYGGAGVALFFIVSGYVILLSAWNRGPLQFLVSRIARLYPAYWFCVTVTTAVILLLPGKGFSLITPFQYVMNLTMVQGAFNVPNIDQVYWTLLVEIRFYVFIFLLLCTNQLKNIRWFIIGWLALSEIQFDFAVIPQAISSLLLLKWSSFFAAGAVFFLIKKEGLTLMKSAVLLFCFELSIRFAIRLAGRESELGSEIPLPVALGLVCAFYGVFFIIAINKKWRIKSGLLYHLGSLTYPVYLLHMNIGYIAISRLNQYVNKYVALVVTIAFILALSFFTVHCIEKPLSAVIKKHAYPLFHAAAKNVARFGTTLAVMAGSLSRNKKLIVNRRCDGMKVKET